MVNLLPATLLIIFNNKIYKAIQQRMEIVNSLSNRKVIISLL